MQQNLHQCNKIPVQLNGVVLMLVGMGAVEMGGVVEGAVVGVEFVRAVEVGAEVVLHFVVLM